MAGEDYEGIPCARAPPVSNFQRYYYFNPLSPRGKAPRRVAARSRSKDTPRRGNFNCKSCPLFSLPSASVSARARARARAYRAGFEK